MPVWAQTPATPGSRFAWTQAAATLADANAFTYRVYLEAAPVGQVLTATCVAGGTPTSFECTAPIPAVTPGPHTVTFTAANAAGESPKSSPFSFLMQAVPGAPTNVRILP